MAIQIGYCWLAQLGVMLCLYYYQSFKLDWLRTTSSCLCMQSCCPEMGTDHAIKV
jgi:hypothetical protein